MDFLLFNRISNSKEFSDLFNSEAKKFFNKPGQDYGTKNVVEYFAEAFSYYYYGYDTRDYLKDRAPKTYKFIKDLEGKEFK